MKTLKDLGIKKLDMWKLQDYTFIEVEELKAEAVKWVKKLSYEQMEQADIGAVEFIKHFFNITDEELK